MSHILQPHFRNEKNLLIHLNFEFFFFFNQNIVNNCLHWVEFVHFYDNGDRCFVSMWTLTNLLNLGAVGGIRWIKKKIHRLRWFEEWGWHRCTLRELWECVLRVRQTKTVVETRDDVQKWFSWHCFERMKGSWCFGGLTENIEGKKRVNVHNKNKPL